MSNYRRHLEATVPGERIETEVTNYYKLNRNQGVGLSELPQKVRINYSDAYCYLKIEREKGISVLVQKYAAGSSWPFGIIQYADADNIIRSGIGICSPDEELNEVIFGQYNLFRLDFPYWATHAYINSHIDYPPIIYKETHKPGMGRLKDISERLVFRDTSFAKGSEEPYIGTPVTIAGSSAYSFLEVPRMSGLYAEVCPWGPTSNCPSGLIIYVDDNDIVAGIEAVIVMGASDTLKPKQYNRYKLKFPEGAVKAIVQSCMNDSDGLKWPPKVYKHVL